MVSGQRPVPGKHRDAEEIYEITRDAVISRLKRTTPIEITAEATLDGTSLTGQVTVARPRNRFGRGRRIETSRRAGCRGRTWRRLSRIKWRGDSSHVGTRAGNEGTTQRRRVSAR